MDSTTRLSGTPPFFSTGQQIVWRYGDIAEPHFALTLTVVRDDADGLVAWLKKGTPALVVERADGLAIRDPGARASMFTAPRVQGVGVWADYDVLRVAPTGRPWSVWVFFTQEGEHLGWYVNLEDVHRRDVDTIYSQDRVLDLWMEPDRTRERKDEDELELAVAQGRYTREQADSFLRDAVEVEALMDTWGSPFSDGWETFRPDPAWTLPTEIPPGVHSAA